MGAKRERGFILIAVLWLIALFTVVALGFSRTTRFRSQEVSNDLLLAMEDRFFASALEMAEFQHSLYRQNRGRFLETRVSTRLSPALRSVMWYPRYEAWPLVMEEQELYVRIEAVGSRIALGSMTQSLWLAVLGACGVEDENTCQEIISALEDWQDEDSLLHPGGAEQKFYDSLTPPYACKNAPIENLEELLLVRGITPELYYGTENKPGLRHFLCLEGKNSLLDINCASPLTFQILQSATQKERDALIALRQEGPVQNLGQAQELISLVASGELARFFQILPADAPSRLIVSRDPDPGPGVRCVTRIYSQ